MALPWYAMVSRDATLLYGDAGNLTVDFWHLFHRHPLAALGQAGAAAAHLAGVLLVAPWSGEWLSSSPPGSGLLDALTAALAVLGTIYLLLSRSIWTWLLLPSLLIPFGPASIVLPRYVSSYRLIGCIPVLFLVVALVLDRLLPLLGELGLPRRAVSVAPFLLLVLGGASNMQLVQARLSDCSALASDWNLLSLQTTWNLLLAQEVNALGARRPVYVVAQRADLDAWEGSPTFWQWLYRVPMPAEYAYTRAIADPAHWSLRFQPPGFAGAGFWPPRLKPGQTGMSYIVLTHQGEGDAFISLLRHAYPDGSLRTLRLSMCATYSLAVYSLTPAQLAAAGTGRTHTSPAPA